MPTEPRSLRKWKPDYTKILVLSQRGLSVTAIATKLGRHKNGVLRIMKSKQFLEKEKAYETKLLEKTSEKTANLLVQDKARKLIEEKALIAAKKLIRLARTGKSEHRMQFDAAKEILHIAGIKPVEVLETRERVYSPEEIESAAKTMREIMLMQEREMQPEEQFLRSDHSGLENNIELITDAGTVGSPLTDDNSSLAPSPDRPKTSST